MVCSISLLVTSHKDPADIHMQEVIIKKCLLPSPGNGDKYTLNMIFLSSFSEGLQKWMCVFVLAVRLYVSVHVCVSV